jgi:hypothetical protein
VDKLWLKELSILRKPYAIASSEISQKRERDGSSNKSSELSLALRGGIHEPQTSCASRTAV